MHGTQKLLSRLKQAATPEVETSTVLGNWYGNVVPWRPHVAVVVNETTLLPVFMPLAPAKTMLDRFPQQLAAVLTKLYVPKAFIDNELAQMSKVRTAKTANRVIVGSMNEFIKMASYRRFADNGVNPDLVELSTWLAATPCGPLRKRKVYPDRELAALIKTHS